MMLQLDELQVYTKRSSVPEIMNPSKLQDLPLLNFEELAAATNWFHIMNKLGQGGFCPVYRVLVAHFIMTLAAVQFNTLYTFFELSFFFVIGKVAGWTRNSSKKTFKRIRSRARRIYE